MSDVKRYNPYLDNMGCDKFFVLASDYDALLAERDALRKDAERYRWLRNNWFRIYGKNLGERGIFLEVGADWNAAGRPGHVDEAIDQAMQGEQP